jgi:hypothetical protein
MANSTTAIYTTRAPTAATCCCPACVGLECLDRTRWFAGQLITEADLNNEQSYLLAKNRLHNRFLHGWGVVCGMQVVCGECDGWVTVKTGYALDPCGNDIIVCQDQPFNVIKAIQACCAPAKTTNCSPLRYTPSPTCQDMIQTWCITIQYLEQQSRMVTPLQQVSSKGSNGSCGSRGQGGMSSASGASSSASSGSSPCASQTTNTVPTGACEPTRINEGFQLGVMCVPQTTAGFVSVGQQQGPAPGTMDYQILQCLDELIKLYLQNPLPSSGTFQGTDQQAYQAVCSYLGSVQNALSASFVTHSQLESALNIVLPPPPSHPIFDDYIPKLQKQVSDKILPVLVRAALDCLCTSFVAPCPPDPCDNRLILACVTVQNGKIINICHFGERRQVVTFPVLYYWLSLFGLDAVLNLVITTLEKLCCGEEKQTLPPPPIKTETITSAGLSTPAVVNRIMTYFISQKLGATMVNAAAPTAQTIDLRPYIGQGSDALSETLPKLGIKSFTQTAVDSDQSWTDDAVAASAQFAPAAFSVAQPLTVFTKGNVVVGFEATNPIDVLKKQVSELQAAVAGLQQQTSPQQGQSGGPSSSTEKK